MTNNTWITLAILLWPLFSYAQPTTLQQAQGFLTEAQTLLDSSAYDQVLSEGQAAADIIEKELGKTDTTLARTYYFMGLAANQKSLFDDGLSYHQKALDIRLNSLPAEHEDIATSYHSVGFTYWSKGKYDLAKENCLKGLEIRKKRFGDNHVEVSKSYNILGRNAFSLGEYDQAKTYWQQALDIQKAHHGAESIRVSTYYQNLGIYHWGMGEYQDALKYFQKVLDVLLKEYGEDNIKLANLYTNMSLVYSNMTNFKKALDYQKKALKTFLAAYGEKHYQVGTSLQLIGGTYYALGDFAQALEYHQKSLAIRLEILGEEHMYVADVYQNIGNDYEGLTDYNRALEFLNKAIAVYKKNLEEKHIKFAGSYNNLGIIYEKQEKFELALKMYQKSLEIKIANYGETHAEIADTYFNIGIVFANQGTGQNDSSYLRKSLNYYDKAIVQYQEIFGEEYAHWGRVYRNFASSKRDLKDYTDAFIYFHKAIESDINTFGAHYEGLAFTYEELAIAYAENGSYEKALEFTQKALEIRQKFWGQDHYLVAETYDQFGNIHYEQGAYKKAYESSEKALNSLIASRKRYTSAETKETHLLWSYDIYEHAIRNGLAANIKAAGQTDLSRIFYYMERAKNNTLAEALSTVKARSFGQIPDKLLQREQALLDALVENEKKRFEEMEYGEERNDSLLNAYQEKHFALQLAQDSLIQQLEEDFPKYYQLKYDTEPVALSSVQSSLTPDQVLIEYLIGKDSCIYTSVLSAQNFEVYCIPLDFPLEAWVNDLREGLYGFHLAGLTAKDDYDRLNDQLVDRAYKLYDKLIKPLGALPEKLIIVPDGMLSYVPFEVMLTEKPDKNNAFSTHAYLLRKHQISYNFSATLWASMRESKVPQGKGIMAMAPSFGGEENSKLALTEARRNLGPLMFNQEEVAAINKMAGGKMFLGSAASLENFKQHVSDYHILHLATHAKAEDRASDFSFLAFTGASDTSSAGKLYIRDLYNLKTPADMVVLSACETGVGELQKGEGVISLARGFAYSGAKSMVTSLWSANDKSTATIMEGFYQNLKNGMTKDEALRVAKINYLDTHDDPFETHPFYWANFVAIGDMEAIDLGEQHYWYWVLGGVLLLGLFFAGRRLLGTKV